MSGPSPSEIRRYARQTLLPGFGTEGQRRLRDASVLVVGLGGLGSPVALYLAAAGVGHLRLVDPDVVSLSNLHRQILYTTDDLGRPKHEAAAEHLRRLNPDIEIDASGDRLDAGNAHALVAAANVVADGTDTFATRYLVNDASVRARTPNAFASIQQFDGQASVFGVSGGPCYRCLFPEPPPAGTVPSCAEGGVIGVLPGLLGMIQATEVIKWLTGLGDPLVGRLLLVDALSARTREIQVDADPACPVCGTAPPSSRPRPHPMTSVPDIDVHELKRLLDSDSPPFVLDVRQPDEYAGANIGGMLLPLGELADRLDELEPHRDDETVVVHCRSGGRSAQAVALLHAAGYTNAVNLRGGIHAWSDEIDSSVDKV